MSFVNTNRIYSHLRKFYLLSALTLPIVLLTIPKTKAVFLELQETCSTAEGIGICVQNNLCCLAVRGRILPVGQPPPPESYYGQYYASAPPNVTQVLNSCSYDGVCCVLPVFAEQDCSVCGVLGSGEKGRATTPFVKPQPFTGTTDTPNSVLGSSQHRYVVERIVDGNDAPPNKWCWQAALLNSTGLIGSGSLIAKNWIVTSARLLAGKFLDEFVIALGVHAFAHNDANNTRVYYSKALGVILHPDFDPSTNDNDIALVRIASAPCHEKNVCTVCLPEQPITFQPTTTASTASTSTTTTTTTTAQPPTTTYSYGDPETYRLSFEPKQALNATVQWIRKSSGSALSGSISNSGTGIDNPYADLVCYMTGWGANGITGVTSVLQETYQQIIDPQQCISDFEVLNVPEQKINLPERQSFCTRDPAGRAGSCTGDGGGPLVCQDQIDKTWRLQGIIALGLNMCMNGGENGPTIFTNVGFYRHWIERSVHEDLPISKADQALEIGRCGSNYGPNCPLTNGHHAIGPTLS